MIILSFIVSAELIQVKYKNCTDTTHSRTTFHIFGATNEYAKNVIQPFYMDSAEPLHNISFYLARRQDLTIGGLNFSIFGFDTTVNMTNSTSYFSQWYDYSHFPNGLYADALITYDLGNLSLTPSYYAFVFEGTYCDNSLFSLNRDFWFWIGYNPTLGFICDDYGVYWMRNDTITIGCASPMAQTDFYTSSLWYSMTYTCYVNWSCSGYGSCNTSDLSPCNDTTDNNACGHIYSGDYSEFSPQSCNYCSSDEQITSTTPCQNNNQYVYVIDNNFETCCNITGIETDCPFGNESTDSYPQSCSVFDYSEDDISASIIDVIVKFILSISIFIGIILFALVGVWAFRHIKGKK